VRFFLLIGALLAVLGVTACDVTTVLNDAAVAIGGCRFPSMCLRTNSDCTRAGIAAAVLCDPVDEATQACDCSIYDGAAMCATAATLCVGRAPVTCPGAGARCLPAGSACNMSGGDPPQVVSGSGDAGTTEARCQYADDVCCPPAPSPLDMSASVTDMSQTD
jgi:hypothetical protein